MDWSHVAEDTAQCRGSLQNINFRLPSSATSAVKTHGGLHTPAVLVLYNPAISNSGSLVLFPRCAHRTVWSQCVSAVGNDSQHCSEPA